MGRILLVVALLFSSVYLVGCAKKTAPVEEYQEAVSMDELAAVSPGSQATAAAVQATEDAPKLESLPPAGPYKPAATEIQTALKNAGFYIGEVDGKIGPMSEKAIKDFQQANNLEADGKVGTKTWAQLSKYLAPSDTSAQKK